MLTLFGGCLILASLLQGIMPSAERFCPEFRKKAVPAVGFSSLLATSRKALSEYFLIVFFINKKTILKPFNPTPTYNPWLFSPLN